MTTLLPPTRRVDVVWQAGDDIPAVVPVPDRDGSLVDVTGWEALVVVVCDGDEVHRWSTEDGSAECGPGGVTLLADDSEGWRWHRGRYEVRVEAPDGHRRVPATGNMVVRPLHAEDVRPPPSPPSVGGELVMRHGDSWESPPFALHAGGEPLPLAGWYVRAEARMDGAARPLFAWTASLTAPADGVEVSSTKWRRRDGLEVTLPTVTLHLAPADWVGKPRDWVGLFEVELTRGSLEEPVERRTVAPARPLRIVPDLIP